MNRTHRSSLVALAVALCAAACAAQSDPDEGMWLLDNPPVERLEREFGFVAPPGWYEHQMKSAVRFGSGGSASFVSAEGLLLTNHHVARGQLAKLSTPENDLLKDGYLARSRAEELKTPDLFVLSLREIRDVTGRVRSVPAGPDRRAAIARLEAEVRDETGLHVETVTLYGGGLYHLYLYERFTDVRVVFAPEGAIGHFGGDVDNFEFPRWCLDMALLRVYRDGEPYRPPHYLRLDPEGADDGDLVFVVGHPGRTQRLFTTDHLAFLRDVVYPYSLHYARTREVELRVFSERSERNASLAKRWLQGFQNWRKGLGGKLRAMQDPRVFGEIEARERRFVGGAGEAARAPMQRVRGAVAAHREIFREHRVAEGRLLERSELFGRAKAIVRLVAEREKPSADRLTEFTESRIAEREEYIFSPQRIVPELEEEFLESSLAWSAEALGGEHPIVGVLLGGRSPKDRARELVRNTRLFDVAARRTLVEGGSAAVAASTDPLIVLARDLDPTARALRERYENEVEAPLAEAYGALAEARFDAFGDDVYPDATSSLRLAFGRVDGFELEGEPVGPFTTYRGLYQRWEERGPEPPFDLPRLWLDKRDELDLATPFNFTSTNDIIGGNSGSPVVDRDGELVGLIFDGNRYSFLWDVLYDQGLGRAVSVDVRSMIEALEVVYGASDLLSEVGVGGE